MGQFLVVGKRGQVGSALLGEWPAFQPRFPKTSLVSFDRDEFDLERPPGLAATLNKIDNLSVILNAAAYTAVDLAEREEDRANRINAESPGQMAKWCAEREAVFLSYSTDYVFPGRGALPWKESDPPNPLNAYGRSKLRGDEAVAAANGRHLILRTSWVYSSIGSNFLLTMLKLGSEHEKLKVVDDQIGAPTYAPDLARASWQILDRALHLDSFPSGIYNVTGQGEVSWYGFALKIFEIAREMGFKLKVREVEPVTSGEFVRPAARPHNSRLDSSKVRETFDLVMPSWERSLEEALQRIRSGRH